MPLTSPDIAVTSANSFGGPMNNTAIMDTGEACTTMNNAAHLEDVQPVQSGQHCTVSGAAKGSKMYVTAYVTKDIGTYLVDVGDTLKRYQNLAMYIAAAEKRKHVMQIIEEDLREVL